MAMVAPRALLVLGNPDYTWLAEESGYVSCRAAHEVWKTFGIPDRFGFSIVANHPHCRLPDSQRPEVEAFVDKFLLDDASVITDVATHSFPSVNYKQWFTWWGSGKPVFPGAENAYTLSLEPECATIGSRWETQTDTNASNHRYVTPKTGSESIDEAPTADADHIVLPFSLDRSGTFTLFGRLDCPSADDDSLWLKMNDGDFERMNGLGTSGWQWIALGKHTLKSGDHKLTIGMREDGLKLDKICLSTFVFPPNELGSTAQNTCTE